MKGQLSPRSTAIGHSPPSRWIVLEQMLIAAECALLSGAILAWLLGGGLSLVATGGIAGLLIAVVIFSLATVQVMPDSRFFATACFLLWIVLVLPLLIVPFALCTWLASR